VVGFLGEVGVSHLVDRAWVGHAVTRSRGCDVEHLGTRKNPSPSLLW
jgi:hypothetical protein